MQVILVWRLSFSKHPLFLFSPGLIFFDRKHFCLILTNLNKFLHSRKPFLFHQSFPLLSYDLDSLNDKDVKSSRRSVLRKHCSKIPKHSFAVFLQDRLSWKFRDTHWKVPVLESLFNKVAALKVCNFIKKETPPQLISCEDHEIFENRFLMEHLRWLLLKMDEEFLRNSNLTLDRFIRNLYRRIYKKF